MPHRSLVPSPRDLPGARYLALLGVAGAALVGAALLAWLAIRDLDAVAKEYAAVTAYSEDLRDLHTAVQGMAINGRGFALTGDRRTLDAAFADGERAFAASERAAEHGASLAKAEEFTRVFASLDSLTALLTRIRAAGDRAEVLAQSLAQAGAGAAVITPLFAGLDSLSAAASARRAALVRDAEAARRRLAVWGPLVALFGIGLGVSAVLLLRAQARARAHDLTRYRAIFDNTFQFMGLLSSDGRLLEVNKTALAFAGLSADAVIDRQFWETPWWPAEGETRHQLRAAVERAASGEFVRYPVEIVGEGGRRLTVDFSLKPVHDLEGRVAYLVPEGRDVTDLRSAERALSEAEERWNFALTGSDLGVWDWNAVTNEVFFSDRWKSMLGFAPHEVGNTLDEWSSRVHPDDLAATMAVVQEHLEGNTPYYVSIHRMRAKDGSWREILDRGKVVSRTTDGTPLRVIGTHQDVTDQRQAERENRLLQQQLSALLKHSPMLITVLDREGRYLQASDSVAAATERPVRQLIGRTVEEVMPAATASVVRTRLREVELADGPVETEDSVQGPDGLRRYRTVLFPLRDASGYAFATGIISLNVTEAWRAQQRLQQSLDENRILQGLLSICAQCKRIRDKEDQQWKPVEAYVQDHTAAVFSHGLCPTCEAAFVRDAGLDDGAP